jgi:imidazole glycerol-phosphate synthase subunit HisF
LTTAANKFGSQCIIISVDAKRVHTAASPKWEVYINGGRTPTGIDALEWTVRAVELGAGEVLLTSMDTDGTLAGYDIELTRAVSDAVPVPVIASGGAGSLAHFAEVLTDGRADAALAASLFHDKVLRIAQVKDYLAQQKVNVRFPEPREYT